MPSFCAVINCNDRYGHSENISFHKFPIKRLDLLKQWEEFIQKQRGKDWHASRWTSLCSRHFREEDFRSLNERKTLKKTAVPSLLGEQEEAAVGRNTEKSKTKKNPKVVVETLENTRDKEFKEILAIKERLEDEGGVGIGGVVAGVGTNVPKSNCRLCGISAVPVATFLTNYELYGMLQKCFPTLNIQQEDALPKVLCEPCHKNLEEFGTFVDRVWTAQTELQRKYRSRIVEKPVKIKQEPLVRVKQEVAESGYGEHHDSHGGTNEDYDTALDGGVHEDGDDQKYEFCDFPIINDCDIMEIINLDDPFINIPDDDNTTTVNDGEENMQKPLQEQIMHYLPTAHELLQSHLLMEEHNYAYIDAEDFKEERQIYKTEKSDNDERLMEFSVTTPVTQQPTPALSQKTDLRQFVEHQHYTINSENFEYSETSSHSYEKRALKPIVTSVSAIQQPTKTSSNGIVVLNESIVKSGCGFQLHACMVCQLKFFSVESLKQHYTQTHGTPMVTVPSENITMEKATEQSCKMEKEFTEPPTENFRTHDDLMPNVHYLPNDLQQCTEQLKETKTETPEPLVERPSNESNQNSAQCKNDISQKSNTSTNKQLKQSEVPQNEVVHNFIKRKTKNTKYPIKSKKSQNVSLNTMANQYQQLKKLYQKLQKKCINLEQNVEQLQLMPTTRKAKVCNNKTNKLLKQIKNTPLQNLPSQPAAAAATINANIKIPVQKCTIVPSSNSTSAFTCVVCSKIFSNSNSLRQHKITHTEERKHICSLCQRSFKRRNGLLQHLKGFHLQVKPFACPVCKHCYALKCDMLRCKHSILKGLHNSAEKLLSKERKSNDKFGIMEEH